MFSSFFFSFSSSLLNTTTITSTTTSTITTNVSLISLLPSPLLFEMVPFPLIIIIIIIVNNSLCRCYGCNKLASCGEGDREWIRTKYEWTKRWMLLGYLEPGTRYQVRVVALNNFGDKASSRILLVQTANEGR